MHPLDAALLHAWHTHVLPRLDTPQGRATLAARLTRFLHTTAAPGGGGLRSFALTLRANDSRLPDRNTAGAVFLDPDEVARLCAPIHLPPPGVPGPTAARLLGLSRQALTARVRAGQLVKYSPYPAHRRRPRHSDPRGNPPVPNVLYHAPPPHHHVEPTPVHSAPWLALRDALHLRPARLHPPSHPPFRQTLYRSVRQLRPERPTPQYQRFEWHCPTCDRPTQRLHWPFQPLNLPAYLGFDFTHLTPELTPHQLAEIQTHQANIQNPLTPGFTCRQCLTHQFGRQGLTYESTERPPKPPAEAASAPSPKTSWNRFIQRQTLHLLTGPEVPHPP